MTRPGSDQPPSSARLLVLLSSQRDLYRQLHGLTERQGGLVDAGEAEPLLALLAQRHNLIEQIRSVNGELEPYRQKADRLATLAAADRQRLAAIMGEIQQFRDAIAQQDERDCEQLRAMRERFGAELGQVVRAGTALAAYGRQRTGAANSLTDSAG